MLTIYSENPIHSNFLIQLLPFIVNITMNVTTYNWNNVVWYNLYLEECSLVQPIIGFMQSGTTYNWINLVWYNLKLN